MNERSLQRRVWVTWLVLRLIVVHRDFWLWIILAPLSVVSRCMIAWLRSTWVIAWRRKNFNYRFEALKKAGADWTSRSESFQAECKEYQEGKPLTEFRRQSLLAIQAALRAEADEFQAVIAELRTPRVSGSAIALIAVCTGVRSKFFAMQRKNEAFRRIFSQIRTSPTFYEDLILWFVLPGAYIDDQLGDLNEEYMLRLSTEGEAKARAWYQNQVITSVKDCMWKRIERLAAIGTLVDLIDRWFRR